MVKQLSQKYIQTISNVLKKQKLEKINELRKMVKEADAEGKDIVPQLKLFGNTAKTYIEIVQKNIIS